MPNLGTASGNEYLRLRAESLIASLMARLEEASSFEFPSAGPRSAIDVMKRALKEVRADVQCTNDERTFVMYLTCIEYLGNMLQYFDNAETDQTPRGLALLMERFLGAIRPSSRLVLWPRAEYNYAIANLRDQVGEILENVSTPEAAELLHELTKNEILLISFPRIDHENILQHVTLGHELGHQITEEFLTWFEQTSEGQEELKRLVEEANKLSEDEEDEFGKQTNVVGGILTLRKRALEELVSDAVGTFIFGPSAVLALHDLLMPGGWDELPSAPEYYPPSRKRLRLCLSILEREGHLDSIAKLRSGLRGQHFQSLFERFEELKQIASSNDDEDLIAAFEENKIAYHSVDLTLERALAFAKQRVAGFALAPSDIETETPELLDRLAADIPPNELGVAKGKRVAKMQSAILAAWTWRVHCIRDSDGLACTAEDLAKVYRLTLRALEYIWLQEKYARPLEGPEVAQ